MEDKEPKLKPVKHIVKPVTFVVGNYNYHSHDNFKEMMLLKAMRVTSDPKALLQLTGMKKVADLSRTFDKISNRREYNSALRRLGMDFDWVAKGLKNEADTAEKSADRIKALQIILKSLGMDQFEDIPSDTGSWEDMLLRAAENKDQPIVALPEEQEYEVVVPEVPEAMRAMREKENERGRSIYEG